MFRYILMFLLVITSYRSLGIPIDQTVSLANPLTEFRCGNEFLVKQIKSQISFCSNISLHAPHSEKELQCLIFYDINTQLCSAVDAKKLVLPEADYTAKIKEDLDMDSLCSIAAKDWVFSDLPKLANYKRIVDKVKSQPLTCKKICRVEDVFSNEVNFFCKYFQWGTDMLKVPVPISSTQGIAINNAQLPPALKPVGSAPSSNDMKDVQVMNGSSVPNETSINISVQPGLARADVSKPETSSIANQNSQPSGLGDSNLVAPPVNVENVDTNVKPEDTGANPDSVLKSDNLSSKSPEKFVLNVDSVQNAGNKPEIAEVTQIKPDVPKPDEDKDPLNLDGELPIQSPVGDSDTYSDGEDGKGHPDGDNDIDEAEDQNISDPKIEEKPAKTADSNGFTFNREQEIFSPNSSQDFPEEDDHFFPFFLTAIIMVVLLYVLYHNKNKVGKVFFGLMLEGRQANRRRNSRGHAYRRLDTLEQAMSANTPAPPSKIIY